MTHYDKSYSQVWEFQIAWSHPRKIKFNKRNNAKSWFQENLITIIIILNHYYWIASLRFPSSDNAVDTASNYISPQRSLDLIVSLLNKNTEVKDVLYFITNIDILQLEATAIITG